MDADDSRRPAEGHRARAPRKADPAEPVPDPAAPSTLLAQPRPSLAGLDRRTIALAAATLVVVWLVLVFGRAVSQVHQATGEAAVLRSQDAAMTTQVQARQAELAVIQSPAFLALEARAYGYGTPSEQVFALQPGSPPPPAITPLGQEPAPPPPPTPLQAWLRLLFGS